tara:strand:- start:294 stop:692 length:399 start_codon:yes stop_codon:yes gene_type:complete
MILSKRNLKHLIVEAVDQLGLFSGPEEEPEGEGIFDEFEEYNAPVYQLQDEMVTAASNAVRDIAIKKLQAVGGLGAGPGKFTANDIELEVEEPLMDALMPLAQMVYNRMRDRSDALEGDEYIGESDWALEEG